MESRILYVVIGLITGLWLSSLECNTRNGTPSYTPSLSPPDTVYVEKITPSNTPSKIVYVTKWKHDTVPIYVKDTTEYLKEYLTIREYPKRYDFKDVCIDVNSLVFQNELAYQNVSYSLVSPFVNHEQPKKMNAPNFYGGLNVSFPSHPSIDLMLAVRQEKNLYGISRSLNDQRWSVYYMRGF